jgi:hypothetical protein
MSPLESVTDFFAPDDERRAAIVARALARERQRSRSRSDSGNGGTAAEPAKPKWMLKSPRAAQEPEHVEVRRESVSPVTISLSARSWRTLRDLARESRDGKDQMAGRPHIDGMLRASTGLPSILGIPGSCAATATASPP